ncbi:XRE family transcriptional regulator [Raoultella planticola]|uniref:XRE family transcriptional regulator n=1 Tax=Raoultella planticola TaxID=575 RepID=UPI0025AAF74E|nr:XRE family transcriptional regulator [Raoultella planticola]MDM9666643.1 XRE family transcriptional regulator [Raoultella planticola]
MPNLLQFSATPSGKGVAISASYDDNTTISFSTDEQSANFMTSIVQALAAANKRVSAAENRAAAERRTADRKYRRTGDSLENGTPTTCDAEFMRLVRAVCPKYNENTKDDDPRLVALDVLRYAPAEAFSAAYSQPMSQIQLSEAIDVLAQVGDYMKANNIEPKPYTTFDTIKAIGDAAKKRWGIQ